MQKLLLDAQAEIRPIVKSSNELSVEELSHRLLKTTHEGYSNTVEPLLVMGLAVMARYKNDFIKEIKGFPVAYLYGVTSAGKSNLLENIAFLLGCNPDDYIFSGDSTVLSMWQKLDRCNCMPIIYDEISRRAINDNYFEGFVKAAFQGINRDKIAKIKPTVNATLIISSNFQPPQRPEILNRLLLCNFEQQNFKLDEVVGFNEVREKYLSNLLPSIVKQKPNEVMRMFQEQCEIVKSLNPELKGRCINNIAIAYTGYQILLNIAKETVPDEVRKNYEHFVANYEEALRVQTPWEEFISSLPLLARNNSIFCGRDYVYMYEEHDRVANNRHEIIKTPYLLCIHFEKAYQAFSAYYKQVNKNMPPTKKELELYAKNDKRIVAGKDQITKGINIGGIKKRCLVLDIRNDYDLCVLDKV